MLKNAAARLFVNGTSLCLVLIWAMPVYSQTREEFLSMIQIEAPRKWREYLELIGDFEGTHDKKTIYSARLRPNPNDQVVESQFRVVAKYPMVLNDQQMNLRHPVRKVRGMNEKYYFELLKKGDRPWVIQEVVPVGSACPITQWDLINPNEGEKRSPQRFPGDLIDDLLLAGLFVGDRWLPNLLAHPKFAINDIGQDVMNGNRVVHISFSCAPRDASEVIYPPAGAIVLLPDEYWLVARGELVLEYYGKDRYKFVVENTYERRGELPVISSKELTCFAMTNGEQINYQSTSKYSVRKTAEPSARLLRLSAYGLPEPNFGTTRRSRIRVLAVVATVFVAILLYCFLKRRSVRNDAG